MTAAPAPIAFDVRDVVDEPREVEATCALFREVWPKSPVGRRDYVRWLYFDNPRGGIVGMNAWDGPTLAAHYVVLPIAARVGGRVVKAALSLNTATHPAYQRRGLFTRLAESTYARAAEQGTHHVVGVANASSTPGFLGKLGFRDLGPLGARIALRLPALPRHGEPAWRREWTPEDLRWRLANPVARCSWRPSGRGVAALAATHVPGLPAVLRVEEDAARAEAVRGSARRARGPSAYVVIGRGLIDRPPSFDVPRPFRSSPLNLILRNLADPAWTPDPAGFELQAIDFDAF